MKVVLMVTLLLLSFSAWALPPTTTHIFAVTSADQVDEMKKEWTAICESFHATKCVEIPDDDGPFFYAIGGTIRERVVSFKPSVFKNSYEFSFMLLDSIYQLGLKETPASKDIRIKNLGAVAKRFGAFSFSEFLDLKFNADRGSLTAKALIKMHQIALDTVILATFSSTRSTLKGDGWPERIEIDSFLKELFNRDQLEAVAERYRTSLYEDFQKQVAIVRHATNLMSVKKEIFREKLLHSDFFEQVKIRASENDRLGVAREFRKIIPWEDLAPSQIDFWQNWLNSLETPPTSKTLVFRGFGSGPAQETPNGGRVVLSPAFFQAPATFADAFYDIQRFDNRFKEAITYLAPSGEEPLHINNDSYPPPIGSWTNHMARSQYSGGKFISTTSKKSVALKFADPHEAEFARQMRFSNVAVATLLVDSRRVFPMPNGHEAEYCTVFLKWDRNCRISSS
jgi:hypothetical protein